MGRVILGPPACSRLVSMQQKTWFTRFVAAAAARSPGVVDAIHLILGIRPGRGIRVWRGMHPHSQEVDGGRLPWQRQEGRHCHQ